MGNRYQLREDMVGLTLKQKKAIWNREAWARKKEMEGWPEGQKADYLASAKAKKEAAAYIRLIRPKGIIGSPPEDIWWETNDASFKRGLKVALEKIEDDV